MATRLRVPEDVVAALDQGKTSAGARVTINGFIDQPLGPGSSRSGCLLTVLASETRIVGIQREEFHRDEDRLRNVPAGSGLQPILPERRLLVQRPLELRLRLAVFGFSSM